MDYKLKEKSWVWKLTFPFAHSNFTALNGVIYHPKGELPSESMIKHESIHLRQQKEVGVIKYLFLYLFCLPFFINPWRTKWEIEAYREAQGLSDDEIYEILSSKMYGWLK